MIIRILFCFLLFLSCQHTDNRVATVDFEIIEERIHIPTTFAGKEMPFLFDTGATTTLVNKPENSTIKPTGQVDVTAIDSNYRCDVYPEANFKVGIFESKIEYHANKFRTPIIGINLISQYNWLFDFEKKQVQLSKQQLDNLGTPELVLDYTFECGGVMTVKLPISREDSLNMIFDTGFGSNASYLLFHLNDERLCHRWTDSAKAIIVNNKEVDSPWLLSDNLTIGDYCLEDVFMLLSTDSSLVERFQKGKIDGNYPLVFARQYKRFYIDSQNQELRFFERDETANKETRDDMRKIHNMLKEVILKNNITGKSFIISNKPPKNKEGAFFHIW